MKFAHTLAVCLTIVLATQALDAQEPGWSFSMGAGFGGENVYPGSDDYYLVPLPSLNATYTRGNVEYSLSLLEGLGITTTIPSWGLVASMNVNVGATRDPKEYSVIGLPVDHSTKTKTLLEGTPDLHTPVVVNTMLAYASPVGLFGVSLGIHPSSVDHTEMALEDETRTGLVYSLLYTVAVPATERLSVSGFVSLEMMNGPYADTWYSVSQPTAALGAYTAEAGLHSTMVALEATYRISDRVSVSALGASTILLGDAKDSPYTVEMVQRTMTTQVLYHF